MIETIFVMDPFSEQQWQIEDCDPPPCLCGSEDDEHDCGCPARPVGGEG